MLPDGYSHLPPGKLAAVVTYLEITLFPSAQAPQLPAGLKLQRVALPAPSWYRTLFREVGSRWLWFGRLSMSESELAGILTHPAVEVFVLRSEGADVGLLELDGRVAGELEVAYLGLVPSMIGRGAGRFLLESSIARAKELAVDRLWLHTCTLDHPDALRVYQLAGFRPYHRAIEVFDDPRLTGLLPRDSAPQVPLIEPAA